VKRILLTEIFFIGILVAVLHQTALSLGLYWTVEWLDILMHFLGGVLIALITLLFIYDKKFVSFSNHHPILMFFFALTFVLIIGLAWELWELYMGMSDIKTDAVDSGIDIVMDTIGGVVAYLYSRKKICQTEN